MARQPVAASPPSAWFAQMSAWRSGVIAAGFGAFTALGHAPLHIWPAAIVGVTALVLLLDGAHDRERGAGASGFWRAWTFSLGYFTAGLWWVGSAFIERGPEFAPFAPLGVAGLVLACSAFWGVAGAVAMLFWTDDHRRIAVFAVALTLLEYARGTFFSGFPWNLFGHMWPAGGPISQIAAHIGVWGLSAITLYAFAAPAALFSRTGAGWTRFAPAVAGFAVLAVVFAAGIGRLAGASVDTVSGVRMRIVHVAIPQQEKWAPGAGYDVLDRYLTQTRAPGLDTRTHVIWPENAVPLLLVEDPRALSRIDSVLDDEQVLLTGVVRRDLTELSGSTAFNSFAAFVFDAGAPRPQVVYDKAKLVPFGEMVPLSGLLRLVGLGETLSRVGAYKAGPGPAQVDVPGAPPVAPQICYEIIFPGFTPRGADRPGWIVNVSNDSWYGQTTGPKQHLNIARYRALEEGVPIVRAANGGFSGVIDPYGRQAADATLGFTEDGHLDVTLPKALAPPFYALTGNAAFALLLAFGVILARLTRR